ncbi:hypothetical protein GCM10009545_12030 [Saccharopolyspora thermophila]|uniref:Uncharacterized protein n=2 Tax=Saccharopolyspora thermophila TaxID=89367 RepID=A0ABP3M2D3_9PSEU
MPPAAIPNAVSRELALVRVICAGRTRGVIAALSTPKDFDSTMQPSAAGYSIQLSKCNAITAASSTRTPNDAASASRRPCCNRSSAGPITGAISANGATVISRYSATLSLLSAVAAEKNSVLASATAIAASTA